MTMVLSYKPLQNTTTYFLGFQSSGPDAGLGRHINDEHGDVTVTLRSVQDQTGLMEDYLQ
jgi:hypothetical protein